MTVPSKVAAMKCQPVAGNAAAAVKLLSSPIQKISLSSRIPRYREYSSNGSPTPASNQEPGSASCLCTQQYKDHGEVACNTVSVGSRGFRSPFPPGRKTPL